MNHKLDLHKEMRNSGNDNKGKYKNYFLTIYISLKDN